MKKKIFIVTVMVVAVQVIGVIVIRWKALQYTQEFIVSMLQLIFAIGEPINCALFNVVSFNLF